ncbi:hypothetical protein HUG17_2677 [Dermatophagoides farinae]|uniref:Uncharacterized protein n=1 Tax=Dermatophagoides farinae TaxID=6954 RepID=A0A9D4NUS6_DERFA|nr:hypothetical protein HUG17_2677 [Dermatophagoides farinae]
MFSCLMKKFRKNLFAANTIHPYYRGRRKRRRINDDDDRNEDVNNLPIQSSFFMSITIIILIIGLILINVVTSFPSSSSSITPNEFESNNPCLSFKMNYSFDFAFNQIITANKYDPNKRLYNHYIYTQKKFLKLYFDHSDRLQVKSIEFQQQQQQQQQQSSTEHDDDYLQNFSGDFGFSLHMAEPMTSKICSARIHQRFITCLDLIYRNISNAYIMNSETFLFEMDHDFRPSIAFQHIGYDHYEPSRFMVIFLEQNLQLINNQSDKQTTTTTTTTLQQKRHFNRRWQVYSFATMERIVNLTYSAILPEYLHQIPSEFEITGVFGWTRKDDYYDEYMIIVFNGIDHLYCLNAACSESNQYQPFMAECRAPESLIALNQQSLNPKFQQQGLVVTKCCGQWEEFSKNGQQNNNGDDEDDDDSQWQIRDGKLYRIRSARSTNLNYVIWSLIILGFGVYTLQLYSIRMSFVGKFCSKNPNA